VSSSPPASSGTGSQDSSQMETAHLLQHSFQLCTVPAINYRIFKRHIKTTSNEPSLPVFGVDFN
jgi:hypothetical protein